MDKKMILCGAGIIAGIAFFLSAGMRVASNASDAAAANGRTPSSRPDCLAGKAREIPHDSSAVLLGELGEVAGSTSDFDRDKLASLLTRLVEMDPEAAAGFVESVPAGPVREEALRQLPRAWASRDLTSAEAWAGGLADGVERQSALVSLCMEVGQSEAGQAVALAEKHGVGSEDAPVMENLIHQWAVQDFSTAAAWIKERPAGEKREQLVMRLALVQSATEPAEAARLVVNEIPEGQIQTEAIISVIDQWARRDMAGAREWVGLFPESELRTRAENELSNIAAYQIPK